MELPKLLNGTYQHDVSVPVDGGYVSMCEFTVNQCLNFKSENHILFVVDVAECYQRKKSSYNTRAMEQNNLSSQM